MRPYQYHMHIADYWCEIASETQQIVYLENVSWSTLGFSGGTCASWSDTFDSCCACKQVSTYKGNAGSLQLLSLDKKYSSLESVIENYAVFEHFTKNQLVTCQTLAKLTIMNANLFLAKH